MKVNWASTLSAVSQLKGGFLASSAAFSSANFAAISNSFNVYSSKLMEDNSYITGVPLAVF